MAFSQIRGTTMNSRLPLFLLAFGLASSFAFAQDDATSSEEMPSTEAVAQEGEAPLEDAAGQEISDTTTVIDLEALINMPQSARLRREADEDPNNPRSLFESSELKKAYLGDKPRFVYIPRGSDPMIIPWIRERIVVGEILDDVQQEFESIRRETNPEIAVASASKLLRKTEGIAAEYPSTNRLDEVQKLSDSIRAYVMKLTTKEPEVDTSSVVTAPQPPREAILPPWIRENTRGVIVDREALDQSVVLVGDLILTEGQSVDRYPSVKVKDIQDRRVIYEFQQTDHVVMVESN